MGNWGIIVTDRKTVRENRRTNKRKYQKARRKKLCTSWSHRNDTITRTKVYPDAFFPQRARGIKKVNSNDQSDKNRKSPTCSEHFMTTPEKETRSPKQIELYHVQGELSGMTPT